MFQERARSSQAARMCSSSESLSHWSTMSRWWSSLRVIMSLWSRMSVMLIILSPSLHMIEGVLLPWMTSKPSKISSQHPGAPATNWPITASMTSFWSVASSSFSSRWRSSFSNSLCLPSSTSSFQYLYSSGLASSSRLHLARTASAFARFPGLLIRLRTARMTELRFAGSANQCSLMTRLPFLALAKKPLAFAPPNCSGVAFFGAVSKSLKLGSGLSSSSSSSNLAAPSAAVTFFFPCPARPS
mmetsp:Transcript_437/g.895  ORF Transcript_437/g.895 Transcript_437/m.895 type:complete len:243 (-) Transcript_437:193-921(-)